MVISIQWVKGQANFWISEGLLLCCYRSVLVGLELDQSDLRGEMAMQRKGGKWARQAAILCADPTFHRYLEARLRWQRGLTYEQLPDGTCIAQDAADFIREQCGVSSRAELDYQPESAQKFYWIRNHWQRRLKKHGMTPQYQPRQPQNANAAPQQEAYAP